MNLVQKLPLGLALGACVFLSSCSKEDAQLAQPLNETAVNSADANRSVIIKPYFPTTNGTLGQDYLASGWALAQGIPPLKPGTPQDPPAQAGTSTFTHLWGNPSMPMLKPLAKPVPNASSVVTFSIRENYDQNLVSKPVVATLKNLTPGKKYSVKIYGATAYSTYCGDPAPAYGRGILVEIANAAVGTSAIIDLAQKQAEWGTATLIFTAVSTEAKVTCSGFLDAPYVQSHAEFLHYLHVYTDEDSITELL